MDPIAVKWACDFIVRTSGVGAVSRYDEETANFIEKMTTPDMPGGRAYRYFHFARNLRKILTEPSGYTPTTFFTSLRCLDRIKSDLCWAEQVLAARKENRAIILWVSYEEQQRSPDSQKVPIFLRISTVFCACLFALQIALSNGRVDDMTIPELSLTTCRITENAEWFRLITAVFFHENIVQFLLNVFLLWWYGFYLERLHGSMKVATIFVLSALGSSLGRAVFTPYGGMVGIKGGITGLMGLGYLDVWSSWSWIFTYDPIQPWFMPYVCLLGLLLGAYVLVFDGMQPFVDQVGLFYGLCFSVVLTGNEKIPIAIVGTGGQRKCKEWVRAVFFALAVIFTIAMLAIIWQTEDDMRSFCPGCQQIACIGFPFPELLLEPSEWFDCDSYWERMEEKALEYC